MSTSLPIILIRFLALISFGFFIYFAMGALGSDAEPADNVLALALGVTALLLGLIGQKSSTETHVVCADDPGMATHLIMHVDSEGRRHEHRIGQTAYGKRHFPAGEHKPDVVFEADKLKQKS